MFAGICLGTTVDFLMPSIDKTPCLDKLDPYGQEHLLQFWDQLTNRGRRQLTEQIQEIDFPLVDSLFRGEIDQPDWAEQSQLATPPRAVRLEQRKAGSPGELGITPKEALQRGESALRDGAMGVILTAGGQGSRLGFEKPKSLYPIGPLSKASLLQIHIEKILAATHRYEVSVPLYLMTSSATHDDTVQFLEDNENFGLAADDLFVFCQGSMPAVDRETGKLLLAEKDRLFLSPDGHGGTVAALASSGAIEHMQSRGIDQLFYLQVDNPLAPMCDAELLGFHLLAESQLTSLTVAKQDPHEKLGNFAEIDGRLHVIEYSDFPENIAELRDDLGRLRFWAGSIAIHIFQRDLLERSLSLTDSLPFHVAQKKVPYLNVYGELVTPDESNALKFERFIFDLLPEAERPIVVEYDEAESFAPLKNAPGAAKDTAEYVRQMMLAQHRRWIEAAGAKVAGGVDVEISPLFALDAAGVTQHVQPGKEFRTSQYLEPTFPKQN